MTVMWGTFLFDNNECVWNGLTLSINLIYQIGDVITGLVNVVKHKSQFQKAR